MSEGKATKVSHKLGNKSACQGQGRAAIFVLVYQGRDGFFFFWGGGFCVYDHNGDSVIPAALLHSRPSLERGGEGLVLRIWWWHKRGKGVLSPLRCLVLQIRSCSCGSRTNSKTFLTLNSPHRIAHFCRHWACLFWLPLDH